MCVSSASCCTREGPDFKSWRRTSSQCRGSEEHHRTGESYEGFEQYLMIISSQTNVTLCCTNLEDSLFNTDYFYHIVTWSFRPNMDRPNVVSLRNYYDVQQSILEKSKEPKEVLLVGWFELLGCVPFLWWILCDVQQTTKMFERVVLVGPLL